MARTPCFPPEVWLVIFDWATFVPFALDTHAPDPFGYPGTSSHSHKDVQKGVQESMCTKRRLVLVCREWRALAVRVLYQAIVITGLETLEELLPALRSESVGEGVSGPVTQKPNGQWVARIDILLPTNDFFPNDDMMRLLSSTQNLQILVVAQACACSYIPPNWSNNIRAVFDALAAKHAPSLRVLHVDPAFSANHHHIRAPPILKAISGRTLSVLTLRLGGWEANLGVTMLDLPNVEYLDIPGRCTEAFLNARNVPSSLVSLPLAGKVAPRERQVEGHIPYAINSLHTLRVDGMGPGRSKIVMHRITVAFPSLRYLIVHVDFPTFAEYLPPVKKLGLYVVHYWLDWLMGDEQVSKWKTLCATIRSLVAITPTVEVVRLFHKISRDDLALRSDGIFDIVRQTSSTLLSKYQVRFEDIDGRLLHSPEVIQGQ